MATVELGTAQSKRDPTKQTRQRKAFYGKTRKEVADQRRAFQRALEQGGTAAVVGKQTVAQFLTTWLEEVVKPGRRPGTYDAYSQLVRLHLAPGIGHIVLAMLSPQDVQKLLNQKLADGLSPRTVSYLRTVLRTALQQAVKWELVSKNTAALTDAPKAERYTTHPLTINEADRLLRTAAGDRLEVAYHIALLCGLREGELLGLRWTDVNLEHWSLTVSVTLQRIAGAWVLAPPKTRNSVRRVPLPARLVPLLKAHRLHQLEERLKLGPYWQDTFDLVFTTDSGRPVDPRNLVDSFKRLLKRAGLPGDVRFHDLRHTYLSLLEGAGVSAKTAQELAGHASIKTTMDIYAHVYDDAKRQAADAIDRLFGEDDAAQDAG